MGHFRGVVIAVEKFHAHPGDQRSIYRQKRITKIAPKAHAQMYHAFSHKELQAWQRCQEVGEDFTRLSQADQLILTNMIERQLTEGTAHFREHAEAWLADVLGEEGGAFIVDRRRG